MVTRWSRLASLAASWIFFAAVVTQVFLAGLGLFADDQSFELHVNLGWILHLAPLLILLLVGLSRPPRRILWLAVALAVVVFVQPLLPQLRGGLPLVAALHPVLALAIFSLSLALALQITASVRSSADSAPSAAAARPPQTAAP